MKTTHTIHVGELQLIRRSDGGVYLRQPGVPCAWDAIRVGSSAAICLALSEAFVEMAREIMGRDD